MLSPDPDHLHHTPSRRRLLLGIATALGVAAFVLAAFVLPAEYAIDPLRIGQLTGLTQMGAAKQSTGPTEVMHAHPRKYRSLKVEITLPARAEMEYKAHLALGEPLLYSWSVSAGAVHYDFHGDPTEGEWPEGFFRSYEVKDSASTAHGSFIAPFTGRHGWYWKNLTDDPIVITLEAAGYYTKFARIEGGGAAVE